MKEKNEEENIFAVPLTRPLLRFSLFLYVYLSLSSPLKQRRLCVFEVHSYLLRQQKNMC